MLKGQGQSFHFCIIILRFLTAFAIAKIAFVGRHRIHRIWIYILQTQKMNIYFVFGGWVSDRQNILLSIFCSSFHFCIIILRFLTAFAIAKIAFVGRHRIHRIWIYILQTQKMNIYFVFGGWVSDRQNILLSIAAEDCCYTKHSLKCWCYIWSSSHTGSSIWCT